ncbi:hypothetical protein ABFS82_13G180400 [Erythranthe guttata]|uniref:Protein BZR1 homolog n=1 Tax=Erythranthe guttata TaxID=4155 RepID=A0A022PWD3_ERYGU|nr:PREDICTED: BES1/BZR1 homolog protein 2-like [Erythranthe guttata]EYU19128.1 hypothetical protein MIMGU_mgv1a013909mg [Erythranthe guttata]|eukprot:XP_012827427.1 PREDICTED: BES1/BZR1 homolog protein 2-like [Erythranthe guttata]
MKELAAARERDGGNNLNGRSAVEKERTKLRERQRRAITTKIFHGLRKHGGYRLTPRADINEVLRHLAHEAGWIIEPDGTTYRSAASTSTTFSNGTINGCPLCGGGRKSAPPTPGCSYLGGGAAGDCSTTASPRRVQVGDSPAVNNLSLSSDSAMATNDTLLAIYMCTAVAPLNACACASDAVYGEGHQPHLLHEPVVSNQNMTAGSP